MCSECTKIRKKTLRIVFGIFCLAFIRKKKRHNNKPQTINTKIGLGLY